METKRPTNPAAEEILSGYFPVLDHGFVALVDYMGSDEDVERAARVSYGYGTRKRSRTRGLIRYLRRHRHTTPSEMVELKFHCCMPIFVARQWIRHRTACLAEGTEVYFDLPGGIRRRGNQLYKLPIEEIWERFQPTRNRTRPDKQRNPHFRRDRVRKMHLRQVDEDTLEMRHTRVVDVYRNGRKPVFRMVLSDGKEIEATVDHRFLFAAGWNTLADETGLREKGGRAVWEDGDHFLYVNGDGDGAGAPDPGAEPQLVSARSRESAWTEGLGPSGPRGPGHLEGRGASPMKKEEWKLKEEWKPRPRIPWNKLTRARLVRIERFEYVGQKETYDLEVEGPHHNFVANGVVTHNSVNEYSGRYSLMPLLFYTPDADAFALQSRTNRQGRDQRAAEETYREALHRWERIRREAGRAYEWMVGEDVARELARIDLPASVYTQWYWKMDLHNLFHFLSLRVDPHAQREIREYATVMAGMVKRVAPLSFEAWVDYELAGAHLSLAERRALARLVEADRDSGEVRIRTGERETEAEAPAARTLDEEALRELGMSGREIREFLSKLAPPEPEDFELDLSRMRPAEEFAEKMAEAVPEVDRDGEREG